MERPLDPGEPCFGPVCDALAEMGRGDPSGAWAALTRAELQQVPDIPAAVEKALHGSPVAPDEALPGDVGIRRFMDAGKRLRWSVGLKARAWLWSSERGVIVGGMAERAWRVL